MRPFNGLITSLPPQSGAIAGILAAIPPHIMGSPRSFALKSGVVAGVLSVLLASGLLPAQVLDAQVVDAEGWTVLDPANATYVAYVAAAGDDSRGVVYAAADGRLGPDPQMPLNPVAAFRTVAAAVANFDEGTAAWVLLHRGDTLYEGLRPISGESPGRPFVFASYGPAQAPPEVWTEAGTIAVNRCCEGLRHFWAIGLSFYAYTRNPADGAHFAGADGAEGIRLIGLDGHPVDDVLFEGNRFRFYTSNSISGAGADHRRLRFRRNVFADNYSTVSHSQGLFVGGARGILLEDNVFDHNGWLVRADAAAGLDSAAGAATIFNHDTYFATVDSARFVGNSFHRPSSIGTKWTANDGERSSVGVEVRDNLYHDCEVGISIGGNVGGPYRFGDAVVAGNVVVDLGRSRPTDRDLGWGITIRDWDGGRCDSNLIVSTTNDTVTNGLGIWIRGDLRDVGVRANTVARLGTARGLLFGPTRADGLAISDNALIQDDGHVGFVEVDPLLVGATFARNRYFASGGQQTAILGTDTTTLAAWLSVNREAGARFEDPSYYDRTRSMDSYITEVLHLPSREAFYARLREFSRFDWDERYGARAINAYLREGFAEVTETERYDADGWTVLDPANAAYVAYVAADGVDSLGVVYAADDGRLGPDPQQPRNRVAAFRTAAAAMADFDEGTAAWVLFRRGDAFDEALVPRSGASKARPFVYAAYGPGDEPPEFRTRGSETAVGKCCEGIRHFWTIGLSFYARGNDPASGPDYDPQARPLGIRLFGSNGRPVEDVLFEGNRFRFYNNNSINGAGADHRYLRFRRNVFADNYSTAGHAQGLFIGGARGILLEDNVFDHNGWLVRADADAGIGATEGAATIFNHDTYFATVNDTRFVGNSFHRPSSIGTKWTANEGARSSVGVEMRDNLYNDCEIGISIGGNVGGRYRFADAVVAGNVVTDLGRSRPTDRVLGWGIDVMDWDDGRVDSNLVLHTRNDAVTNGYGIGLRGGLRGVSIRGNTLVELGRAYGILFQGTDADGVAVAENTIAQDRGHLGFMGGDALPTDYAFAANRYGLAADGDDAPGEAPNGDDEAAVFARVGYTLGEWVAAVGEEDAVAGAVAFADPARSLDRYIAEVLGLPSREAFYARLRTFSRERWDERYGARAINAYLREGFTVLDSVPETGPVSDLDAVGVPRTARAYPNPTTGIVYVPGVGPAAVLEVYDALGRLLSAGAAGPEGRVDLSALDNGVYVVRARGGALMARVILRR